MPAAVVVVVVADFGGELLLLLLLSLLPLFIESFPAFVAITFPLAFGDFLLVGTFLLWAMLLGVKLKAGDNTLGNLGVNSALAF